jgi:hypothetical protein
MKNKIINNRLKKKKYIYLNKNAQKLKNKPKKNINKQNAQKLKNNQNKQNNQNNQTAQKLINKHLKNKVKINKNILKKNESPEYLEKLNEDYYEKFKHFCIENVHFFDKFDFSYLLAQRLDDNIILKKRSSILIYFDKSEHIEFIIKNNISKLGKKYNHYILCCKDNYDFMNQIIKKISNKIKLFVYEILIDNNLPTHLSIPFEVNKDDVSLTTNHGFVIGALAPTHLYAQSASKDDNSKNQNLYNYNSVILNVKLWELINSEKVLIYNEYSCLFNFDNTEYENYNIYSIYNLDEIIKFNNLGMIYLDVNYIKNILNNINKEDLSLDIFFEKINENKNKIGNNLMFGENCYKKEFNYNFLMDKIFKKCAITTPYGLNLGGGEINLINFAKYFIIKKHCLIYFFVNEREEIRQRTLKMILGDDFIKYFYFYKLNEKNNLNYNYDYHFNMENEKIPSIKALSNNVNIYHCQFPFDTNNNIKRDKIQKINKYDYIFLNSDFTYQYYKKFTDKYLTNNQNINIIYPSSLKNIELNNKYIKKRNSFVMIGRIFDYDKRAHNKNFDIALKYFEKISELTNDFEVHIIGKVYSQKMLTLLKGYKIKNLYFHINCSNQEKENVLKNSEYILNMTGLNRNLLTECYAYEHFGISIIEGINHGCIPISVNGGYPSYYIKNNENGYKFKNEEEFYDIIKSIIIKNKKIKFEREYYDLLLKKYTEESFFKSIDKILN